MHRPAAGGVRRQRGEPRQWGPLLALTMLLTARSLEVEQTATLTPLSMASSAQGRGASCSPGADKGAKNSSERRLGASGSQLGPAAALPRPLSRSAAEYARGRPQSAGHSLMRRFTPGRTGRAPVSISWLKMSV